MQIDSEVRDELAHVAQVDFEGVSLGEALRRLVTEHQINGIIERFQQLREDPEEWASYQSEARLADNVAGETLPNAGTEYPEYNQ